ncbi:hypothetical protein K505DRAFT_382508, partial [Melanomma pulvis-pyrius CBS 109.77]
MMPNPSTTSTAMPKPMGNIKPSAIPRPSAQTLARPRTYRPLARTATILIPKTSPAAKSNTPTPIPIASPTPPPSPSDLISAFHAALHDGTTEYLAALSCTQSHHYRQTLADQFDTYASSLLATFEDQVQDPLWQPLGERIYRDLAYRVFMTGTVDAYDTGDDLEAFRGWEGGAAMYNARYYMVRHLGTFSQESTRTEGTEAWIEVFYARSCVREPEEECARWSEEFGVLRLD